MLQPKTASRPDQAFTLAPGVSLFEVLIPSGVLGPNGESQFGIAGPFVEINSAATFAAQHPGSMVTVRLVLFQTPYASVDLKGKR